MNRKISSKSLFGSFRSTLRSLLAPVAILAGTTGLTANHQEVPILVYGPIVPANQMTEWRVSQQNFEAHMQSLANNGFTTITLAQFHAHLQNPAANPLPEKAVILTFTNGYRHLLTHVNGVLNQHGFTGAAFLVTNVIADSAAQRQTSADWDEGDANPPVQHLIWSEVRTLANNGWEIGSHTRSHINFSTTTTTAAQRQSEIAGSKTDIENELGTGSVRFFSYPNGAGTNIANVRNLVEANYDLGLGVTGSDGPTNAHDAYALPRLYVLQKHGSDIFHTDLLGPQDTDPGDPGVAEHHPADSDGSGSITLAEVIAYGTAWREGGSWDRGPNPPTLAYVINAGTIWRLGGTYTFDPNGSNENRWQSAN